MIQGKELIENNDVLELLNKLENALIKKDEFLVSVLLTQLNLLGYNLVIDKGLQ